MFNRGAPGRLPIWMQYLPLCGDKTARVARQIVLMAFFVYLACNYYLFETNFIAWDYLLLTGMVALWFGLYFVIRLETAFHQCIERLFNRQVLTDEGEKSESLRQRIDDHSARYARLVALICTIAMVAGFLCSVYLDPRLNKLLLTLPVAVATYISGCYLGRMVSHGKLATQLQQEGIALKIFPYHVDGVGGLKPIGDFYFSQAMIAAIPVLFLGIWTVLIPHWPGQDYSDWSLPYFGLLVLALTIMMLAFLAPMIGFHHQMKDRRQQALQVSDHEIHEFLAKFNSPENPDSQRVRTDQLESLRKKYWLIENMPTWPLHTTTYQRFRRNYLLLLAPLVTRIVDASTPAGKLAADLVNHLVSG